MKLPSFIPEPLDYANYSGNWDKFNSEAYDIFKDDFEKSKPQFNSIPVYHNKKLSEGKCEAFWHVTSTYDNQGNRNPDIRRTERVAWIKPLIENENDSEVCSWIKKVKNRDRVHIWLKKFDFLVVLEIKGEKYFLVTAMSIMYEHKRKKLRKEYDGYKKTIAAQKDDERTPSTPGG